MYIIEYKKSCGPWSLFIGTLNPAMATCCCFGAIVSEIANGGWLSALTICLYRPLLVSMEIIKCGWTEGSPLWRTAQKKLL